MNKKISIAQKTVNDLFQNLWFADIYLDTLYVLKKKIKVCHNISMGITRVKFIINQILILGI